jgi:hypothetical protein
LELLTGIEGASSRLVRKIVVLEGLTMSRAPIQLPLQIGPCQLSDFGAKWVAVRCPSDFDPLMREAAGLREPGNRRWLIPRRRIRRLVSALWRNTDPLFRRVGLHLEE